MPDRAQDVIDKSLEGVCAQQQPAAILPGAGHICQENEMSKGKNNLGVCPRLDLDMVESEQAECRVHSNETSISRSSDSVSTEDYSGSSSANSSPGDSMATWTRAEDEADSAEMSVCVAQHHVPSSAAYAPTLKRITSTDDALILQARSLSIDEGLFESVISRVRSSPCLTAMLESARADGEADSSRRPPALHLDLGFKRSRCDSPLSGGGTPRMCPWGLWQKDSDAPNCSIVSCGAAFDWKSRRRHHCRQCGRVVCSKCSSGTKKLLIEEGTPSSPFLAKPAPRPMRVCVACAQSPNTFSFSASSDRISSPRSALFSRVVKRHSGLGEQALRKTGAASEGNNMVERAAVSIGKALASPLQGLKGVRRQGSASIDTDQGMSLASTMNWPGSSCSSSQTSSEAPYPSNQSTNSGLSPTPSPHDDDTSRSDVKFVEIGGSRRQTHVFAQPPALPADVTTKHELPADGKTEAAHGSEESNSRIAKLHKELENSSYYHGLLQHEPAALKVLTGAIFDVMRSREKAGEENIH